MEKLQLVETEVETRKHIDEVRIRLLDICKYLMDRAMVHDASKLVTPEAEVFAEFTPKLKDCTYNSDEYKSFLKAMAPALEHHYAKNDHHPEFNKEIWLSVVGYEDNYEISNYGNLRSKDREIERNKQGNFQKDGELRQPHFTPAGYLRVMLSKNGESKNYFIHRLVAEAFLENPKNKPMINHKNSIRCDNRLENLEWVTASENLQHAYDCGYKEAKVKYIVHCIELDITTLGVERMEKELRKKEYEKASAASIWRVINSEEKATHLDLHFIGYLTKDYSMPSSIQNMDLLQLIELISDWKAATLRHTNGNIKHSLKINMLRYNIDPQVYSILENTVNRLGY